MTSKEIINEYKVEKIVIGYPLNMNATKGPRAEKTDKFIEKLKSEFNLDFFYEKICHNWRRPENDIPC